MSSMSITWAGSNTSCSANKMNIAARKSAPTLRRKLKSCRSRASECAQRLQRQQLLKACYVVQKNFAHLLKMSESVTKWQNFVFQHLLLVARLPYRVKSSQRTMVLLKSLPMFHASLIRALALLSWDLTVRERQHFLRSLPTNLNLTQEKLNMAMVSNSVTTPRNMKCSTSSAPFLKI